MAKIFPLSEGEFTIGHDKIFQPFNAATDVLNDRPTGSLLVEIQPFLVVTDNDIIILDTGLGFHHNDGTLQIHHNIRQCGYEPSQVTKVLLTHLHKDHAGGVSYKNENGIIKPTFDNAQHFIYRKEADYALQVGYPSYVPDEIEPLFATGQVQWLDEEEGIIDNYIRYTHSGGHSPQHIVFLITDGQEKIFFGGDEAPQLKQMKMKYIAKYDYDGKKAMTRASDRPSTTTPPFDDHPAVRRPPPAFDDHLRTQVRGGCQMAAMARIWTATPQFRAAEIHSHASPLRRSGCQRTGVSGRTLDRLGARLAASPGL